MIKPKKILFFSDSKVYKRPVFLKNAASLRLSYLLRKHAVEVKQQFHFLSFDKKEIKYTIESYKPDIICVSTSFLSTENDRHNKIDYNSVGHHWGQYENFEKILCICYYGKLNNSIVIIGGWETNLKTLAHSDKKKYGYHYLKNYVDSFVVGDGYSAILDFVQDNAVSKISVNGLNVIFSKSITDFSDNASTPTVDDIIFYGESLTTELASGCIFSCSFCNYGTLGKKKYEYMRSYESLKNEIISNYENFGVYFYTFTDNIINDYDEKLKMIIKIKNETGIDIRWTSYARLDTIKNKDDVMLLKDSGAAALIFGIESLNKNVGSYIGKLTDKNRLIEKLYMCRETFEDDVLMTGLFINGLPTETLESCDETFDFLQSNEGKNLLDNYSFSTLHIYEENNTKNLINKKRNNPFRDYKITNDSWESPWGKRKDFAIKTHKYYKKKPISSFMSGFSLNSVHNSGIEVRDVISMKRKFQRIPDESLEKQIYDLYITNTLNKIENYKTNFLQTI